VTCPCMLVLQGRPSRTKRQANCKHHCAKSVPERAEPREGRLRPCGRLLRASPQSGATAMRKLVGVSRRRKLSRKKYRAPPTPRAGFESDRPLLLWGQGEWAHQKLRLMVAEARGRAAGGCDLMTCPTHSGAGSCDGPTCVRKGRPAPHWGLGPLAFEEGYWLPGNQDAPA